MQSNSAKSMEDDEMYYDVEDERDYSYQEYFEAPYGKAGKSKNKEFSDNKKVRQNEREQQRKMKRNNNWEN